MSTPTLHGGLGERPLLRRPSVSRLPRSVRGPHPIPRPSCEGGGEIQRPQQHHPGRTRPGSRPAPGLAPGREAGRRRRPSWRAGGGRRPSGAAATPPGDQTAGRGRGQPGRRLCREAQGRLPGPRSAQPAHRGRSGPRPGAFRAREAACPGKSRPPSRRRHTARQSGGRGFPESAPRPPARHCAESDHIWASLPLRQRGKPRCGRGGRRACALGVWRGRLTASSLQPALSCGTGSCVRPF